MSILDDRGRIKGTRWNIIDLYVVIGLLCFLGMVPTVYKIMTKKSTAPTTIAFDKAEYESEKAGLIGQRDKALKERNKLRSQINNLLKKHKRLKRYFKEE